MQEVFSKGVLFMFDTHDNSDKVINIPINAVKPNPYRPRKFFDVTSVSELSDSIKEMGLIQPISVRRLKPGTYELVSGERRLRAAEMAGLEEIRAIVMSISDDDCAKLALAENIQRKNINFFEEATAFYNLIFEHMISREELSKSIGVSETRISKMLKLSRLSSTVKNIIIENGLTEEHAFSLLKIPDEAKRLEALKKAIEIGMTAKDFARFTDNLCQTEPAKIIVPAPKPMREVCKPAVSDYRIIFNTLNKALKLMEEAGVKTKSRKTEHKNFYEYVIRIAK